MLKSKRAIHPAAYISYYESNGNITDVKILTPNESGNYSFDIENDNYKIMLWDNFNPIINAIKQSDRSTYTPITAMEIQPIVCNDFAEKVTASFKVDENDKAELNVAVKEGEEIHPAAYIAYFDSNGKITDVKILTPNKNGNYSFDIENANYKIMLWDNFNPIINAIKQ